MSGIEAADKVEIQILVDNATDMLSSNPPPANRGWAGQVRL